MGCSLTGSFRRSMQSSSIELLSAMFVHWIGSCKVGVDSFTPPQRFRPAKGFTLHLHPFWGKLPAIHGSKEAHTALQLSILDHLDVEGRNNFRKSSKDLISEGTCA